MTIQIIDFRAVVATDSGPNEYYTRFEPGLNVLRARNSWGKSTLLHGMVFAVGLEGAFTSSQGVALTPAMTHALDLPSGRESVLESYTTLTIRNQKGQYLRTRRYSRSLEFGIKLIQTWVASSERDLDTTEMNEYHVRHKGSAQNEGGFHYFLANFLGCELPLVPAYGGGEVLLYLELILPLFFVEQKFGWPGIAPRIRTNMKAREPLKRGVEYLLGLSTLQRINEKNLLRDKLADLKRRWDIAIRELANSMTSDGQRVSFLAEEPILPSKLRAPILETYVNDKWIPSKSAIEHLEEIKDSRREAVSSVEERTGPSKQELQIAEKEAIRLGSNVRRLQDQKTLLSAELAVLQDRQAAIDADRRRLEDAKLVAQFGGKSKTPLLADNKCPTCEQDVDAFHTAFGEVFSLKENISFLKSESEVVRGMRVSITDQLELLERTLRAMQHDLGDARQTIRLLRDELVSPSSMPSVAQLQNDLIIRGKIRALRTTQALAENTYSEIRGLSEEFLDIKTRLDEIQSEDLDEVDLKTLSEFQRNFRSQLQDYGLRSVSSFDVDISKDSLLPDNGGFALSFNAANMDTSVSASDTVRTKWAYITSLYEVASNARRGRHPGILIFDEPRQQEVDRKDVVAFMKRLSSSASAGQIIYVTSEENEVVAAALEGLSAHFLPADGEHLFS